MATVSLAVGQKARFRVEVLMSDGSIGDRSNLEQDPVFNRSSGAELLHDLSLDADSMGGEVAYLDPGSGQLEVIGRPLGAPADGSGDVSEISDIITEPRPVTVTGIRLVFDPPTAI